ncbi:MAG TPA: 50S ribosomal protein L13 [Spirochaetia bacterium]|nr:50S ribosomal protein L13 [Spirochaetia bacterium]
MNTIFVKPRDVERKWFVIDADGKSLGRVAAKVAYVLRGKNKPIYTPHQEIGDYVIVLNAAKVAVTGRKRQQKMYYHHSGYLGGMKVTSFEKMIEKKPTFPLERAIQGMLPHNRLGRKLFKNVKVYAGESHPHVAQKPEVMDL